MTLPQRTSSQPPAARPRTNQGQGLAHASATAVMTRSAASLQTRNGDNFSGNTKKLTTIRGSVGMSVAAMIALTPVEFSDGAKKTIYDRSPHVLMQQAQAAAEAKKQDSGGSKGSEEDAKAIQQPKKTRRMAA